MEIIIKEIWIESEVSSHIIDGNIDDDNSDVIVTFFDDTRYVATFFTYKNIQTLRTSYIKTGECFNGKYFWASDLILIDKISREDITQVIDYLLLKKEFHQIFKKL